MSTKSDSFLQKVENGHSVHWIQKPSFELIEDDFHSYLKIKLQYLIC